MQEQLRFQVEGEAPKLRHWVKEVKEALSELEIDPSWLIKVLHYDGTPITARFITQAITHHMQARAAELHRRARST